MRFLRHALIALLVASPGVSFSAQTPEILEGEHHLVLASGRIVSEAETVAKVIAERPIQVPGSMKFPNVAERAAKDWLARNVERIAPGARVEDFELVSNSVLSGMRTVGFVQTHRGLPVENAQLSVRFKKDRLFMVVTSAHGELDSVRPSQVISQQEAKNRAVAYLREIKGLNGKAESVRGPLVLQIPGEDDRVVVVANVRTTKPASLFSIYLDAQNGAPVARRQLLMFASGTLRVNTPLRYPGAERVDLAARDARVVINSGNASADQVGSVTWSTDQEARVTLIPEASRVRVENAIGATASVSFSLADGGSFTWDARRTETVDSQVITYLHSLIAKDYAKELAPWLTWLDNNQLPAIVNIDDICNAFSDGDTINFFQSGQGCENTGRIPDVVYHEFGHALHFHVITPGAGRFDSALSEGLSDFFAASITGDPATARGFFMDDSPLRDIDPPGFEAHYPENISRDPHETGLIVAGALWDLRKVLVEQLGQEQGEAEIGRYFIAIMARAGDILSSYDEALAEDDDDGDLTNGTPNYCTIRSAFAAHGLAGAGGTTPIISGLDVSVVPPTGLACPGTELSEVKIIWEVRGEPGSGGEILLTPGEEMWTASLPRDRTRIVIRYKVQVTLGDGQTFTYPNNNADPQFEAYIGEVTPIYCTDFENDPYAEGWYHESLVAGEPDMDDWQLGTPQERLGSGDPNAAHSGINVFGNDLGLTEDYDGRYQSEASNRLVSPFVDTSGFSNIRLQYWRWLGSEDSKGDQARIWANQSEVWLNAQSAPMTPGLTHVDREWRFQDVDVSAAVSESSIQIIYEMTSNRRRRYGGWNIDDFCIVAPAIACGDGFHEGSEACDDGNLNGGDGCEADCSITVVPMCGNGQVEAGEACDDGNAVNGDGCESSCTMTVTMMPMDPSLNETPEESCGCRTSDADANATTPVLFGLLLAALLIRRRSRG